MSDKMDAKKCSNTMCPFGKEANDVLCGDYQLCDKYAPCTPTVDELVARLEELKLDYVIHKAEETTMLSVYKRGRRTGRYKTTTIEPLADMLMKAMDDAGIHDGP